MELSIFFGIFVILLFIGAPIYLSLIVPSLVYIAMTGVLTWNIASQKLLVALNSFPLMAVPLFMLAANIMNQGSVTKRLFGFARACVGHFRGGLGYVNVFASLIFSGMSGSALADVGGLGQIEIRAMRDAGYDDDFTFGVTAASGTIGPIVPPSIPFVIFAGFAGVSTGALFLGGLIPGVVLAAVLCAYVFIIAKKRNYPKDAPITAKQFFGHLKESWLALLLPFIIIGGIWSGWFTPTEAALIAIVYALIICMFVYKDFGFKHLPKILLDTAKGCVPVMMVVVGGTLFCWIITYNKIDQLLFNSLVALTDSKWVVLLIICVVVTFCGMFFEGTVITMLLTPVFLPICAQYHINIIHLGVIVTLGQMIGLLTPPVGMSLYVMSSVTGKRVDTLIKYIMPWFIPLAISWLLVVLFEPLSTFIPTLAGM